MVSSSAPRMYPWPGLPCSCQCRYHVAFTPWKLVHRLAVISLSAEMDVMLFCSHSLPFTIGYRQAPMDALWRIASGLCTVGCGHCRPNGLPRAGSFIWYVPLRALGDISAFTTKSKRHPRKSSRSDEPTLFPHQVDTTFPFSICHLPCNNIRTACPKMSQVVDSYVHTPHGATPMTAHHAQLVLVWNNALPILGRLGILTFQSSLSSSSFFYICSAMVLVGHSVLGLHSFRDIQNMVRLMEALPCRFSDLITVKEHRVLHPSVLF
ncbi:hypothetical protein F5Y05DRAFT_17408 [Hypoxylon sp. FL0543]|nr:hypothetical protein F5Y05DRAFT_17408 [Hypoxylon sp. FL0543]